LACPDESQLLGQATQVGALQGQPGGHVAFARHPHQAAEQVTADVGVALQVEDAEDLGVRLGDGEANQFSLLFGVAADAMDTELARTPSAASGDWSP
jgi:hypothetical protein